MFVEVAMNPIRWGSPQTPSTCSAPANASLRL